MCLSAITCFTCIDLVTERQLGKARSQCAGAFSHRSRIKTNFTLKLTLIMTLKRWRWYPYCVTGILLKGPFVFLPRVVPAYSTELSTHLCKHEARSPVACRIASAYDPSAEKRGPYLGEKGEVNCLCIAMETERRQGCQRNVAGLVIVTAPSTLGMCTTLYAPTHTLLHLCLCARLPIKQLGK